MILGDLQGKEPYSGEVLNYTRPFSEPQKRESKKSPLIDNYCSPGSYINQPKQQLESRRQMNVVRISPFSFLIKDCKSTSPSSKLPPSLLRSHTGEETAKSALLIQRHPT